MAKTKVKKAKKTKPEKKQKSTKKKEDVYSHAGREALLESDEISPEEAGFMEGYENENLARCSRCEKPLLDNAYEEEIGGEIYRFCSEECAEMFEPEIE